MTWHGHVSERRANTLKKGAIKGRERWGFKPRGYKIQIKREGHSWKSKSKPKQRVPRLDYIHKGGTRQRGKKQKKKKIKTRRQKINQSIRRKKSTQIKEE